MRLTHLLIRKHSPPSFFLARIPHQNPVIVLHEPVMTPERVIKGKGSLFPGLRIRENRLIPTHIHAKLAAQVVFSVVEGPDAYGHSDTHVLGDKKEKSNLSACGFYKFKLN